MKDRILEISDVIFAKWGYIPERDELKAALSAGEQKRWGVRYVITKDPLPSDAVLAIPEHDEERRTWIYHVISADFAEDDPDFLTPEITQIIRMHDR